MSQKKRRTMEKNEEIMTPLKQVQDTMYLNSGAGTDYSSLNNVIYLPCGPMEGDMYSIIRVRKITLWLTNATSETHIVGGSFRIIMHFANRQSVTGESTSYPDVFHTRCFTTYEPDRMYTYDYIFPDPGFIIGVPSILWSCQGVADATGKKTDAHVRIWYSPGILPKHMFEQLCGWQRGTR